MLKSGRADGVLADEHTAGDPISSLEGPGSLICSECGFGISLAALEELADSAPVPVCSVCGGTEFKRASIFDQPTVLTDAIEAPLSKPAWLTELRLDAPPGPHVAYYDGEGEGPRIAPIAPGWTRIGRAESADIRLDDPSVSRRHALIVRTETDALRALDDRSLNGLFVNGRQSEWTELADGDELEIGRFRLHIVIAG